MLFLMLSEITLLSLLGRAVLNCSKDGKSLGYKISRLVLQLLPHKVLFRVGLAMDQKITKSLI